MKFCKNCILGVIFNFYFQYSHGQVVTNGMPNRIITTGILPNTNANIIPTATTAGYFATNAIYTTGNPYFTTTFASFATPVFNPNSNDTISENANDILNENTNDTLNGAGNDISNAESSLNNTDSIPNLNNDPLNNSTLPYNNTLTLNNTVEYDKNTNWTVGYGTHYGPFPSSPHFSEVGYQPNDVGVGCSDGRPGGDPKWQEILAKGVYPPPNLPNHENTVWPVAYTVAVSLAVWNKEDVCWKTIKIRNKHKPEYVIEAYIVDFCPIGHCQWNDDYLARNVDIYGEQAWFALGADENESRLKLEIEWPKGIAPHDALKLPDAGFSRISHTLMTLVLPLFSILILHYLL